MPVAVKMTKTTISEYLQQSFMKEMTIMSQMMHPNIVRLYGIVSEGAFVFLTRPPVSMSLYNPSPCQMCRHHG